MVACKRDKPVGSSIRVRYYHSCISTTPIVAMLLRGCNREKTTSLIRLTSVEACRVRCCKPNRLFAALPACMRGHLGSQALLCNSLVLSERGASGLVPAKQS